MFLLVRDAAPGSVALEPTETGVVVDPTPTAAAAIPTVTPTAPPTTAQPAGGHPPHPPGEPTLVAAVGPDRDLGAGLVDLASVGAPYSATVSGSLTFRGNPTRTFYGTGPVPAAPQVAWSFPDGALCSSSSVGGESRQWCGTGWTGQPAVFERDGRTWVVFGAYDAAVHFLDAETGERLLPDFGVGDLIKGSVTVDPDGFPLVYVGSRDNRYRVLAIDGPEPVELWGLDAGTASGPTLWNNDWDSAGLVLDDHLLVGGENSRFYAVRLHRAYGPDGRVTVAPEIVWDVAGWDDEVIGDLGDQNLSIESSIAVAGDVAYFGNSGGLIQGWDLSGLAAGTEPARVLRFWIGDDTDASVVVDPDGMLLAAAEFERGLARAREVGQVVRLDPSRPDDPLLWGWHDPLALDGAPVAGVWATPAVHREAVIVPTDGGLLVGLDRASGAERWRLDLPGPLWSSPVVVDDVLLQGDCAGFLHAFDVAAPLAQPRELWSVEVGGCIESTPTVWDGSIYVGTRGGQFHALR